MIHSLLTFNRLFRKHIWGSFLYSTFTLICRLKCSCIWFCIFKCTTYNCSICHIERKKKATSKNIRNIAAIINSFSFTFLSSSIPKHDCHFLFCHDSVRMYGILKWTFSMSYNAAKSIVLTDWNWIVFLCICLIIS